MLHHILKSWRANRGNLLAILGSLTGLLMCVVWYFQLLPDIQLLPQDFTGAQVNRTPRGDQNRLVLTVKPPILVPRDESSPPIKLKAVAELYPPVGILESELAPQQTLTFELESNRTVAVVFGDVRPGKFSALVFLDLNENGKLDFDDSPFPSEPFRLSSDPTVPNKSLSLEAAAFEVAAGETQLIEFDFRTPSR